uniref:Uncharacterized LOC115438401 n=1 Tax=Sphaeramia orbicularis TaxID=375764 RepID=A0A672ZGJ9_9TELE
MTMEKNKKTLLLVLHVALFQVCVVQMEKCQSSITSLTCYNDYRHNITCTYASDHADNVCTIHADMIIPSLKGDSDSCKLEPFDVSRPELKKCSLILNRHSTFKTFTTFSLNLTCVRGQNSDMCYKPVNHIKLDPPEKPNVTNTTVSWKAVMKRKKLRPEFELQWKREDQSWSDPSVQKDTKRCDVDCAAELNPDTLIQDESYRARIRVRPEIRMDDGSLIPSTWSDWSPTASWVSLVGRTKQKSDAVGVGWFIAAAAAVFALFLVLFFRTDRTTWVYVIKLMKGPPLPSSLQDEKFQKWQSSFFTSESYLSFLKPLDIDSVEVTCAVDDIAPCKQELLSVENSIRECSQESSSSSFSNPSYSQLCPVRPICSLSAGNLEPCAADSPYGPAGGDGQSTNPQQGVEKQRGKNVDIMQLLSKANNREAVPVISDYEKVEKVQVECNRLQSVDSGMCSGEEVSQESLEPDSITQSLEEEPESKKQWEEGNGDCLQKLFGHSNSGDSFNKGSIEVCSDYEQVQKLQVEIPDDMSVDSDQGISRDQQLSHHHILSTPSTCSRSDPPTVLLLPSFTPSSLNFTRPGSSPGPGPLAALIDRTVMSHNSSLEPSADGYLPVTQEEN